MATDVVPRDINRGTLAHGSMLNHNTFSLPIHQMTLTLFLMAQAQLPFKLEICHQWGGVGCETTVLTETLGCTCSCDPDLWWQFQRGALCSPVHLQWPDLLLLHRRRTAGWASLVQHNFKL